jgi:hypothetical protein
LNQYYLRKGTGQEDEPVLPCEKALDKEMINVLLLIAEGAVGQGFHPSSQQSISCPAVICQRQPTENFLLQRSPIIPQRPGIICLLITQKEGFVCRC